MKYLLFLAVAVPVMVAVLGFGIGPVVEWIIEVTHG